MRPPLSKTGTESPVNSSSSKSCFEIRLDWFGWFSFKLIELTISYGAIKPKDIAAAEIHAKTNTLYFETIYIHQSIMDYFKLRKITSILKVAYISIETKATKKIGKFSS